MRLISRLFTFFFLAAAVASLPAFAFDHSKSFAYVILPFLAISLLYQRIDPITRNPLERGELRTDVLSTMVVIALTALQGYVLHFCFEALASDRISRPRVESFALELKAMPLGLECVCAFVLYDFMFYVTHRLAHSNGLLWRLHSVHHGPSKVTYMNSNRIHPLDLLFRRVAPNLVLLVLGISGEAFVFVSIVVDVLGPISHLNVNLRHGAFNYLVGTNEIHVWHHSADPREARNYGITMIWDHLFGTFYFPKDRKLPERFGLSRDDGYPIHDFWRLLLVPWRWRW